MKKFKTISEYQILEATYHHYLERWAKNKEQADNGSIIGQYQAERYWKILEELHEEILRIEEKQKQDK